MRNRVLAKVVLCLLAVATGACAGDDADQTISTLLAPTASGPTAVVVVTCSGFTCTFDGRQSSDPQGIVRYEWHAASGSIKSTQAVWTTTFPVPKSARWRLYVWNAAGLSASFTFNFSVPASPPTQPDTIAIPLLDMTTSQRYLGRRGGHYPGGRTMPAAHRAAGAAAARRVNPIGGRIVLLAVGQSNAAIEFCDGPYNQCAVGTFMQQARADQAVRGAPLKFVPGARGSTAPSQWSSPTAPNYDWVRSTHLAPRGLTEAQVRVVWLKIVTPRPTISLPSPNADAYDLVRNYGKIARALKARYPNLELVFLSNRTFAGYATGTLNPEPYAYESGFAVKWLIQAQIHQMSTGQVDPVAGNLNYNTVAPWLGWGPDLWARGTTPRSDGLRWRPSDFRPDGVHPAPAGVRKVAGRLLQFFKTSPQSVCWFLKARPACT